MYEEEVFEECESGLEFVSDNTKSTSILVDEDMKLIYRIKATGITFDDVCGMDEAKQLLKLPLRNKGIVLFGVSIFLRYNWFCAMKMKILTISPYINIV